MPFLIKKQRDQRLAINTFLYSLVHKSKGKLPDPAKEISTCKQISVHIPLKGLKSSELGCTHSVVPLSEAEVEIYIALFRINCAFKVCIPTFSYSQLHINSNLRIT